ncbi:MAG: ATP-binding protein [Solobacterium sp.]|nr:ATP-binding protein [Solobacterium sp.]
MARENKEPTAAVVRKAFLKILPLQIFGIVIIALNTFIDSLITSRFLGTEALAAIGLFCPVTTLLTASNVLIVGVQILCSKYIGSGEGKKVVNIFSAGVVFLTAVSTVLGILCFIFRYSLASLLGASGNMLSLLAGYTAGFAFGIPGQILFGMMMFLPLNNDMKRSYIGSVAMVIMDIVLDLLCAVVMGWGTLGMGIATSLANTIGAAIVMSGFRNTNKAVHLYFKDISYSDLPQACVFGLPNLMFTIGNTVKAFIMNRVLLAAGGGTALAVMNVQGNVCAIVGSVPLGAAGAFISLASVYYGEEDRKSFIEVADICLKYGIAFCTVLMVLLMAGSSVIPSMFFSRTDVAWNMARRMLLLFPSWLIGNIIFNLFMRAYQCQGEKKLVNFLSLMENLLIAGFTAVSVRAIGTDGAWLAFPFAEAVCIFIMAMAIRNQTGKIRLDLPTWLRIKPDFGVLDSNCLHFSMQTMDEVVNISERVIDFCKARGLPDKISMLAGLSIEEMAGNVILHGFTKDKKRHNVDVRIAIKHDRTTIRVRDDCRSFDPMERLKQFTPDDVTKNIGIRMIVKLTEEVFYQNNAGINTLLIRI